MPYSLRVKVKKLRYKGMLTDKECDRLCKALEREPCEDCISRHEVLSIIECRKNIDGNDAIVWIEKEIGELPSVTPQPRTGRWINIWDKNDYGISTQARCNRCKQISDRPLGIFCKWCGAKMEVSEDARD